MANKDAKVSASGQREEELLRTNGVSRSQSRRSSLQDDYTQGVADASLAKRKRALCNKALSPCRV